jgi:mannose-1-phosphate guanylyltransferase
MKAVVLVGGEGTRLRPLTETTPKPLLPLVDRAILDHVLDHLVAHGVHEVVMSSPYLEETFHPFIRARQGDPAITWITEREALGTGGAVVSALDRLGDAPFFAVNGDVLTDLDLTAMLASHRQRAAAVTIALHRVDDARPFGLVETDPTGQVRAFREKPPDRVAGDINAGTYVLEPSALRGWPRQRYLWIEGEVFPSLIASGAPVHGFDDGAYWIDLGTPEQYLRAHVDLLQGAVRGRTYPAPWIGPRALIDTGARLERWVTVGPRATIATGAHVEGSVVLADATVERDATIARSILGTASLVGEGASLVDSVLGAGAVVPAGASLHGERVAAVVPHP